MAIIYPNAGGGGSVWSVDLTARRKDVMENKTAIVNDSNDAALAGTLPLNAIKLENGGNLQINGITSFSVSQSTTTPNTAVFTFSITPRTGQPWGGIYVRYKEGSYPSSITDGTECGYYSQSGSTYTHTAAETTTTYYYRAWNFYRYSETVSSPQTYPLIKWGTYKNATCKIKRHAVPYILTYPGNITSDVSGSITVPIGYTHADVAVIAIGGYSGAAYGRHRVGSLESGEDFYKYGKSGGEGGEVKILSLSCSSGQTMSWSIGKCSTTYPKGTSSGTSTEYYTSPWTQGLPGNDTTFTFNGTTTTCLAGNCGQAKTSLGAGGTGRPGADGGAAGSTTVRSIGGNGVQGTYFTPTQTYYGGGGCGVGTTEGHRDSGEGSTYWTYGRQGTADPDAYGHGANAPVTTGYTNGGIAPTQPGAIIISFT